MQTLVLFPTNEILISSGYDIWIEHIISSNGSQKNSRKICTHMPRDCDSCLHIKKYFRSFLRLQGTILLN